MVSSYWTDLAWYRDLVFGVHESDYSPRDFVGRADRWLSFTTTAAHGRRSGLLAQLNAPYRLRMALVHGICGSSPEAGDLIAIVELFALGAAMHDAIGEGRPAAPVSDRILVLLGDALYARALARAANGPQAFQWLIKHAFERLILSQFASHTVRPASFVEWESAVNGGPGMLTASAARIAHELSGGDLASAATVAAVGGEAAFAAQLLFDIGHPLRRIGAAMEVNNSNSFVLTAAKSDMGGIAAAGAAPNARSVLVERALVALKSAKAHLRGVPPPAAAPLGAVIQALEARAEQEKLH